MCGRRRRRCGTGLFGERGSYLLRHAVGGLGCDRLRCAGQGGSRGAGQKGSRRALFGRVSVGLSCGDVRRRRGGGELCVNRLVSRCQRMCVENSDMHGISRCGDRGSHPSGDGDCGGMRE
jgi:hypothetical protein